MGIGYHSKGLSLLFFFFYISTGAEFLTYQSTGINNTPCTPSIYPNTFSPTCIIAAPNRHRRRNVIPIDQHQHEREHILLCERPASCAVMAHSKDTNVSSFPSQPRVRRLREGENHQTPTHSPPQSRSQFSPSHPVSLRASCIFCHARASSICPASVAS